MGQREAETLHDPDYRETVERLDRITRELDAVVFLLFDAIPSERLGKPLSMTEKVGLLDSMGFELADVSRNVGRPSNYVSSRLREYKQRNSARGREVGPKAVRLTKQFRHGILQNREKEGGR
jgi:hypothetical protein